MEKVDSKNQYGVGPRFDLGRAPDRSSPNHGLRMEGLGLAARTGFQEFFLELPAGWLQLHRGSASQHENRVSILLGAQPFDLWRRM